MRSLPLALALEVLSGAVLGASFLVMVSQVAERRYWHALTVLGLSLAVAIVLVAIVEARGGIRVEWKTWGYAASLTLALAGEMGILTTWLRNQPPRQP